MSYFRTICPKKAIKSKKEGPDIKAVVVVQFPLMFIWVFFVLLPGADGEDLQQSRAGHFERCAELRAGRFVQELEGVSQQGFLPTQLRENV